MPAHDAPLLAGVDVGGTHIRVGITVPSTRRVLDTTKFKSQGLSLERFCVALRRALRSGGSRIAGIGIAVNGFCDGERRRVLTTYGVVPFLENCDLAAAVEQNLGVRTFLDNDARAHVAGEFEFGGWGKPRSLVVLTLGTGVGLAWQVDGRLYPPPDHGAMGGHMIVAGPTGNPCFCGAIGCLESLASGTALAARANERLARFVSSALKFPAASEEVCRAGKTDTMARACIENATEALQFALHTLHHLYFPDLVVLGGGLAPGLWPYLRDVRRRFESLDRFDGRHNRLVLSRLGDRAGILGASALVKF